MKSEKNALEAAGIELKATLKNHKLLTLRIA
jgi:hypothetical protein